jgi:phosphoglucomutase
MTLSSIVVPTTPFEGQKPGTSGLRKKVKVFMEKNYTENFIQCILDALGDKLQGSTLIVGGDGRYFSKQAINIIIRIAAANGVSKGVFFGRGCVNSRFEGGQIDNRAKGHLVDPRRLVSNPHA